MEEMNVGDFPSLEVLFLSLKHKSYPDKEDKLYCCFMKDSFPHVQSISSPVMDEEMYQTCLI